MIDPMLWALGWDVGDPDLVRIERPVQVHGESDDTAGRPDYALLGQGGNPVVLIEAKKLAAQVTNKARRQVVAYVTDQNMDTAHKVPFCACTNGDSWQLYDVLGNNLVFETSLSRNRSEDSAFKLLGLWRRSLSDGSLRAAVQAVGHDFASTPQEAVAASDRPQDQAAPAHNHQAGRPPRGWDRLTRDFAPPDGKRPMSLWLPTGEVTIKFWRDVIIQAASWLLQQSDLRIEMLPIHMGKSDSSTRYLMNVQPTHPNGSDFHSPKELLDGRAYLEANLAPREIVQLTRKLFSLCDRDPEAVGLKF